uniref:C3H1-type domain-containing protein n=1 Tax=Lygus hesperus TaxID=30085 RepID=A0A0K8SAN6_LYGHE
MREDEKKEEKRAICRDFVRNKCSRGDSCKYLHPKEKKVFCHDFQYGRCVRKECAFLRYTHEEKEYYDQTGQLPALMEPPLRSVLTKEVTLCKDYLNGECDRNSCKYRHLQTISPATGGCEPLTKRRRYEYDSIFPAGQVWTLEDENVYLRKAFADLRKRVDDLQATNEFLLEQNAQLRLTDKAQSLTAVTVPAAVTITNGQIQPQVSGAIRTVTASVATVPVSIAAVAAGTPVSIATVSMSPVISATSVTMATPHQGTSDNQQTQTLLSTTAGQLVSYPLVARPVITNLTH